MIIESVIEDAWDGKRRHRDMGGVLGIMVHRVGVDHETGVVLGYDGLSIAEAFIGRKPEFARVASATGGENAYTFFVGGDLGPAELDGKVWQALAVDEVGWHARRFSRPYLAIGVIGDFRRRYRRPPSEAQLEAVADLCAELSLWLGLPFTQLVGHGEVDGAHGGEKAPGMAAACPGGLLDMNELRDRVGARLNVLCSESARDRLVNAGAKLPPV